MSIFPNIFGRLHARLFPEGNVIFTVRTTPRIGHFVLPIFEKLIRDDKIGETYRFAVAFWHRWDVPPLNVYLGTVSLCRIDGPSTMKEGIYRPVGGMVETPGLSAGLSSEEAYALDTRIRMAIEKTIRDWAEEHEPGEFPQQITGKTQRGRRKTAPQDKGAENA